MIKEIFNIRYKITYNGWRRRIIRFFRVNITQRWWFNYLYHRFLGHRVNNSGYDWCYYCNYHQEGFEEPLYPVYGADEYGK